MNLLDEHQLKNNLLEMVRYIKNNHQYCLPDGWKDENRLGETISDRDVLDLFVSKYKNIFTHPKPAITMWPEVKQKYLEHLIDNYDHGYLALFEWLEKNYSGIELPETKKDFKDVLYSICKPETAEIKYQQCPECFNSDKNCSWCNGEGIIPIN